MKCEHEKLFGSITIVLILLFWFFELERGSQWVGANTPTPTPTATPTPTPVPCDGFTISYFPSFDTNVPQVINNKIKQGEVDVTGKTLQLPFTGAIQTGIFTASAGIIKDGHNPETSWEENRDWDARIIWQPYCFLPDGMYVWYFDYGVPDGGGALVNGWEKWANLEIEPAPAETPEPGAYTYTYTWEDKPQIGNGPSTNDDHVDSSNSVIATVKWIKAQLSIGQEEEVMTTVECTFSTEPSVSAFNYYWEALGAVRLINDSEEEVTQLFGEDLSSVTVKMTETDCGAAQLSCSASMERYPWLPDNESPNEIISAVSNVSVIDPWAGTNRCGDWTITTYYTPREESFSSPKTTILNLDNGTTTVVRADFKNTVYGTIAQEGWGRLEDSDPKYPGQFIGLPSGGVWKIRSIPLDNHESKLEIGDIATKWDVITQTQYIPNYTKIGFTIDYAVNGIGPEVRGTIEDNGDFDEDHLDLYCGILRRDEYSNATFNGTPVARSDQ